MYFLSNGKFSKRLDDLIMMTLIVNYLPSVSFGILLEYLKPYQNPSSNDKTWHNQSMKLFVQDVTLKAGT